MNVWPALVGGFAGTLVLTTTLAAASRLRLTRMDIPFLLGTAFTDDRSRARVVGFALHAAAGLVFALVYAVVFAALGRAGWALGMLFGLVHALFAGTTLVNVLLRPSTRGWGRRTAQRARHRCWSRPDSCC